MADRLPAGRLQARQAGGPPALTAGTAVFRRKRTSFTVSETSAKNWIPRIREIFTTDYADGTDGTDGTDGFQREMRSSVPIRVIRGFSSAQG